MKILFITSLNPSLIGGERLRPYYLLKYLSRNHAVKVLCFTGMGQACGEPLPGVTMESMPLSRGRSWYNAWRGLFSPAPLQVAYFHRREMGRRIRRELDTDAYDAVFCHLVRMAGYLAEYRGVPKVLDLCDALSRRYRISSRYRGFPFNMVEALEARRLERYERSVSRSFDLNLVSSSVDREYFEGIGVGRLFLLENGIECPETMPAPRPDSRTIVLFANFRAFPNADAFAYFYKKIFPLVKKAVPDAQLRVAGADIQRAMRGLRDRSVEIREHPGDMRAAVEGSCVSVVPMRVAVGIQNKVLQSMAWGIPVVATPVGRGGIGARPGTDILLADTAEDFAAQVVYLLRDPGARRAMAESAFGMVKRHYRWQDIVERFERRLGRLQERRRRRV